MTKELFVCGVGRVLVLNKMYQNHWLDKEREKGFSLLENISGGNF